MKADKRDRIGATRGKIAVVGALGAVLVTVLASNFRGAAEEPAVASLTADAAATPVAPAAPQAPALAPAATASQSPNRPTTAAPFGEFAADGDWPAYSLEKLVRFDPFAAPAWMAVTEQSAEDDQDDDQTLKDLQEAQNAIILVTGDQRVARIGSQEYRVGDMVGAYRITDISSAGIVLSDLNEDADAAK
jgi:hypothetical protein